MEDLKKSGLLMDGEVAIQPEGYQQPFIYRGFQMIDEEKLRELRGDELRKMNQNGMRIVIATDAWHPQVNGVVRTLTSLANSASGLGEEIAFLTPEGFPSMWNETSSRPEISHSRLALSATTGW